MLFILFFYNSFNSVNNYFNALSINLYYNCKLDFKSILILLYNKLLQASI